MADKDVKAQSTSGGDTQEENLSQKDVEQSVDSKKNVSSTDTDTDAALETSKDDKTAQSTTATKDTSSKDTSSKVDGTGADYVAPETDDKSKTADEKKAAAGGDETPNTTPATEADDDLPPTTTELSKMVADSSTVSDVLVKSFEERLDYYLDNMRPGKPISMEDAARNQVYLWDTLRFQLDLNAQDFAKVMDMTLAKIADNLNGAFSTVYLRRGFERMDAAITAKRRNAFDLYLNLLTRFAGMENKSRLSKYVDLPRTASAFTELKHQTRIQTYFGSFR